MNITAGGKSIYISELNNEGTIGTYKLILDLIKKLGEIETNYDIREYNMYITIEPKTMKEKDEDSVLTRQPVSMTKIVEMANDPKNKNYQTKLFTALDSKVEEGVMDHEQLMDFLKLVMDVLCTIYTTDVMSNIISEIDPVASTKNRTILYLEMNDVFDALGYKYEIVEVAECTYKLQWKS